MDATAIARRRQMLLLGAIDMDHVIAAAEAIQRELQSPTPNEPLIRALGTAVVVCYWRPFAEGKGGGRLRRSDARDAELHRHMKTWRNQAGAHNDPASGRTAGITPVTVAPGDSGVAFTEYSWEFPPEDWLPRIIDIAAQQRDEFRAKAESLPSA